MRGNVVKLHVRVNMASKNKDILNMKPTQPHDEKGRFTTLGDQSLSSKVRGVRLPADVDRFIEDMPKSDRPEWMRKVLSDAARRELGITYADESDFTSAELAESQSAWQSYLNGDDPGMSAEALKAELFG